MSVLDWISGVITGATVALGGHACPALPDPVIVIRPLEEPMRTDFKKNGGELGQVVRSHIKDPVPGTGAALGGLMNVDITANTNVTYDGGMARKGEGACIWPSRVDVDVVLAGTLYVNVVFPPGSCQHDAIAEHELEHYTITKELVEHELPHIHDAVRDEIRKIGVIGPLPPEKTRELGKPVGDRLTAKVQEEIVRLNKMQELLNEEHDSPIENVETLTACRKGGGFVYKPFDLPVGAEPVPQPPDNHLYPPSALTPLPGPINPTPPPLPPLSEGH
jgi:hypothetical protein